VFIKITYTAKLLFPARRLLLSWAGLRWWDVEKDHCSRESSKLFPNCLPVSRCVQHGASVSVAQSGYRISETFFKFFLRSTWSLTTVPRNAVVWYACWRQSPSKVPNHPCHAIPPWLWTGFNGCLLMDAIQFA
jgi:hypothetical protein